jgi:hypothetical protein
VPPPLIAIRKPTGKLPVLALLKVTGIGLDVLHVVCSADGVRVTGPATAASLLLSSTSVAVIVFGVGSGSANGSAWTLEVSCKMLTRAWAVMYGGLRNGGTNDGRLVSLTFTSTAASAHGDPLSSLSLGWD